MAATPPLTKTPTDVVSYICDRLDLKDLLSLRQTCHWAENETFTRCFKSVVVRFDLLTPTRLFIRATKGDSVSAIGKCVKNLTLIFRQTPEYEVEWAPKERLAIGNLVVKFPMLERLDLTGMHALDFERHLRAATKQFYTTGAKFERLRTLRVIGGSFVASDLQSLLQLTNPAFSELWLMNVEVTEGKWHDVLSTVASSFEQLEILKLGYLTEGDDRLVEGLRPWAELWDGTMRKQAGEDLHQAVQLTRYRAYLRACEGFQDGVSIGLDMVLNHLAASG